MAVKAANKGCRRPAKEVNVKSGIENKAFQPMRDTGADSTSLINEWYDRDIVAKPVPKFCCSSYDI